MLGGEQARPIDDAEVWPHIERHPLGMRLGCGSPQGGHASEGVVVRV